jgi:hypothetical protein
MLKVIAVAALAALAVGGVGYATAGNGDGNDQGSGVQAWAQVDPNGGAPQLVQSSGIVSVSSPQSGVYCLKGAPRVDLAHTAPVASQEVNLSTTIGLAEPRRVGAPNSSCAPGQLQIDTWDASNTATPTLVNTVGFDVVVP